MRSSPLYMLVLVIALTLTGCSVASGTSGSPIGGPGSSPAPAVAPSTPMLPPTPVDNPAPAAGAPSTQAANSSDPTTIAIQAVIQKANQEQQDAFAKGDPTVMKDTATAAYYNELAQINSDMANGGVTAINLVKIDWGQVNLTNATTAQVTTFETWQTTYSDGSSDQSRDQNVYTLVQEQGVWKIQSDDHPNSSGSPGPSGPSGPVTPSSPSGPAASGSDVSRNWSGYSATGGTFTSVTGTWTVPQSQSQGGLSSGATWVGIGGVQSRDLIQAGTEETADRSGGVSYDAWIEMLPRAAHPIQLAVKPGDSVTVTISEQGSNQWLIDFQNHTTGESYQTTVQYASSLSSAEWIEEAPSVGHRIVPIDNFGTIQFSGGSAVENGKSVTIAQSGAQPVTLTDGRGAAVATPSVLTPDGQGFSVSQSTSAAPQAIPGSSF